MKHVCLQGGPLPVLSGLISPISRGGISPHFPNYFTSHFPSSPYNDRFRGPPHLDRDGLLKNHMTGMNSPRFTCLSKTILRTSGPGTKLGNIRIEFNTPGGLARHHHTWFSKKSIWMFPKKGYPQLGWFIMEIPIKMDDLGVPLFSETPISTSSFSSTAWYPG